MCNQEGVYVGWFGILMFPLLAISTIGFLMVFLAAPPVDIDGIREPVSGSLVTSSLLSETSGDSSLNTGYSFGQTSETYNISSAHGYFGRLIMQFASFNNSRSLHFFLGA